MIDKGEQKLRIQRYLLWQMSADERAEFENQYAADSELFDAVVAVEDEMIGAYLRGKLPVDERRLFASRFLKTPAGRRGVEFAQCHMDSVSSTNVASAGLEPVDASAEDDKHRVPAGERSPFANVWHGAWSFLRARSLPIRIGMASVWLIGVVGGSWMVMSDVHLRRLYVQMRAEQQDLRRQEQLLREQLRDVADKLHREQQTESELQRQIAQLEATSSGLPAFVLMPHSARGGGSQKPLIVAPGSLWVRLQINLPYDDYPAYSVSVETPEGSQIWHGENLKSRMLHGGQPAILVNLPANDVASRTYILRVTGNPNNGTDSAVADYSFRTTKR